MSAIPEQMIVERPTTRTVLEALRIATLAIEDDLPTDEVHLAGSLALDVICTLDDHGYLIVEVNRG